MGTGARLQNLTTPAITTAATTNATTAITAKPHPLKVPYSFQAMPPVGDKVFKHTSPWETFIIKLQQIGSPTEPESRLVDSTSQLSSVSASHTGAISAHGYTQLLCGCWDLNACPRACIAHDCIHGAVSPTLLCFGHFYLMDSWNKWTN